MELTRAALYLIVLGVVDTLVCFWICFRFCLIVQFRDPCGGLVVSEQLLVLEFELCDINGWRNFIWASL